MWWRDSFFLLILFFQFLRLREPHINFFFILLRLKLVRKDHVGVGGDTFSLGPSWTKLHWRTVLCVAVWGQALIILVTSSFLQDHSCGILQHSIACTCCMSSWPWGNADRYSAQPTDPFRSSAFCMTSTPTSLHNPVVQSASDIGLVDHLGMPCVTPTNSEYLSGQWGAF